MYSLLNIIPDLIPEAEKFVINNDRNLYAPFFQAAEEFCIENRVIIGGQVGVDLLVGKPLTKDSFYWELYTDDTFNTAKKLSKALYRVESPHVNSKYVALRTDLRHKEMTIMINTRQLFKIYSLDKYRGIELAKLMGPVLREGYLTKKNISCIPEEMQLIEIYHTLYTPAKAGKWVESLAAEQKIFDLIGNNLEDKALMMVGGSAPQINRQVVDKVLMEKIINQNNNVLIGDYALGLLDKGLPHSPRVQFISDTPIDDIAKAAEIVIGTALPNLATYGFKITFVKYPLNLPTDFQITKHTLYITMGKEQSPIADVYNSSTFEMIPYWNIKKIKIGNPWVLLRFRFIDLWVLKLISRLDSESAKFLRAKMIALLDDIKWLRKLTFKQLDNDATRLFQLSDYVGVYVNEIVAKKKLIKDTGEKFANYYPSKDAN
jgi:hypothetical protein